jgi:hypothetical protein
MCSAAIGILLRGGASVGDFPPSGIFSVAKWRTFFVGVVNNEKSHVKTTWLN